MSDVTFTAEERAYLDSGDASKLTAQDAPEAKTEAAEEPDIDFGDDVAKEAAKEPEKVEEKPKVVPHQALHAERLKRQEVERQLAAQREQFARYEQRMQELNALLQPKEQVPDPVQDPIAALQYTQKQLQDLQAKAQQEASQRQQQEQEQAVIRQVEDAYRNAWTAKLSENPQHAEAYQAFIATLNDHFEIRGVLDPVERAELVKQEERAIAYANMRNGIDPADAIIQRAHRYGYTPKPVQPPAPDPAKVLADKQRGIDASRSVGSARGGSTDNVFTAQRIAEMTPEEFEAFKAKVAPSKFNRLMGAA